MDRRPGRGAAVAECHLGVVGLHSRLRRPALSLRISIRSVTAVAVQTSTATSRTRPAAGDPDQATTTPIGDIAAEMMNTMAISLGMVRSMGPSYRPADPPEGGWRGILPIAPLSRGGTGE